MPKAKQALEFKGRMLSLTRVRVLDSNPAAIDTQLKNFARQMSGAAEGLPVILESDQAVDLPRLLAALRAIGVQPLAAMEGALTESARAAGLPVLALDLFSDTVARQAQEAVAAEPAPAAVPAEPAPAVAVEAVARPTRVITEPVRSGQQIYAEGGDLIVMQQVSAGAELIADGCIHVYGHLRGRAIAGARGDATARIFCRRMEAELLAIAGTYTVSEQVQGALRGQAVQAFLADGKLRIEKLE